MPNQNTTTELREQLREAKLGARKLSGEINRLAWLLDEAKDRVRELERQLAERAA